MNGASENPGKSFFGRMAKKMVLKKATAGKPTAKPSSDQTAAGASSKVGVLPPAPAKSGKDHPPPASITENSKKTVLVTAAADHVPAPARIQAVEDFNVIPEPKDGAHGHSDAPGSAHENSGNCNIDKVDVVPPSLVPNENGTFENRQDSRCDEKLDSVHSASLQTATHPIDKHAPEASGATLPSSQASPAAEKAYTGKPEGSEMSGAPPHLGSASSEPVGLQVALQTAPTCRGMLASSSFSRRLGLS